MTVLSRVGRAGFGTVVGAKKIRRPPDLHNDVEKKRSLWKNVSLEKKVCNEMLL